MTIDQSNIWIILALIGIGGAIIGFLIAVLMNKKNVASIDQKLQESKTKNSVLAEKMNALNTQLDEKQSTISRSEEELDKLDNDYKGLLTSEGQFKTQAKSLQEQLATKIQEVEDKESAINTLRNTVSALQTENEQTKTRQEEKDSHYAEQLKLLEENKETLTREFENLANKIFESKGKTFTEQNKTSLDALLKPFKEQMEGLQKRVNDVHSENLKGTTELQSEIKKVLEIGLKMSDEATNLTTALKGDKKAQGNWGEVQVELLLEKSGLREGHEYLREANYKTEDGKNQRPDFIINLPGDKHIIVDSKISLNAYVSAMSAETEEEQNIHLKSHVDAIRNHVKKSER